MGISAKWIKSLVGIKKHEKAQTSESSGVVSRMIFSMVVCSAMITNCL